MDDESFPRRLVGRFWESYNAREAELSEDARAAAKNFRITDDDLGKGSAKEKFRDNIRAITTLKQIEDEHRTATPEEQQILSQYVGWGGLADAFDETKSNWSAEYQELKSILTPEEYNSARESTLNAHFTSPVIIRNIYEALGQMGFEKGNILEPAMGVGNFFGMLPEEMQDSKLYGVELDDLTLRAWSNHPNLKIVDNDVVFEKKIQKALREVYRIVGEPEPMDKKHKYLIQMPDMSAMIVKYGAVPFNMKQHYLVETNPTIERRIRQQKNGSDNLVFYTEKHTQPDSSKWDTERPISQKEYNQYLLEVDPQLQEVRKTKYRFNYQGQRFEIDVYPFSQDKAVLFCYADHDEIQLPPEIRVLQDVTGVLDYKNKTLARVQRL